VAVLWFTDKIEPS